MRIVFMGTPGFAVPSLDILHKNGHEIVSVVTVPDRKKGRGLQLAYSDVKQYAVDNNLLVLQPEKLKDPEFVQQIKDLDPDLIVVVAFRILPKEIFTLPKYGSINLHASLLPKYRGAAPINWAIINGDKETGVTTFFLKEKVDTGNIIIQRSIPITEEDTAGTLHDKLAEMGKKVLLETVNMIGEGNVEPLSQNDNEASPAPKIFKHDCLINWDQPAEKINNFIRGLSPYPAAFTYLDGKVVKIYETKISEEVNSGEPGKIEVKDRRILVNSSDKKLDILGLQMEGKKKMKSSELLNGMKLENSKFTNKA